MALSPKALASIQSAGAAVYAADCELKSAVKDYAEQVHAALQKNPFDVGNDSLFEDWKTVARLSQAIAQIEQELRNIYHTSTQVATQDAVAYIKTTSLAAPAATSGTTDVSEIVATDVVAKKAPRNAKKLVRHTETPPPLKGNAARLLAQLPKILSTEEFSNINKAGLAKQIGLPQGSVGAAIKRLLNAGYLIKGDIGQYKLAATKR
ncbi:MAG: hypothetical protein K9K38_10490 [Rhodoferax sp.]|nr:hypothetical protein [Rhodoferax sp.]